MKKLNLIKKTGCCSSTIDINEDDIDMDFFNSQSSKTGLIELGMSICNEFKGKALWLSPEFDYILGKDSTDNAILIPLKKK